MTHRLCAVCAAVLPLAGVPAAVAAPFGADQLIIIGGTDTPLVLDISMPATPVVLADLGTTLPVGRSYYAANYLRWGADGHLYHVARTPIAGTDHDSVWEYDANGYIADTVLPESYFGIEGFALTAAGDFIIGDRDKPRADPNVAEPYIRQYQRSDPSQYIEYSYPDANNQGDDNMRRQGSTLYVAGNHYVALYDLTITPPTQPALDAGGWVQTTVDNDVVAAAADGRFAVNTQWDNFDDAAYRATVELFDAALAPAGTLTMPQYWNTKDLAFGADGRLYVLSNHYANDGSGWMVDAGAVRIYDAGLNPVGVVDLPMADFGLVYAMTVPIPEPAGLWFVVGGGAWLLRRRYRARG